jgi:hypothetical protein
LGGVARIAGETFPLAPRDLFVLMRQAGFM